MIGTITYQDIPVYNTGYFGCDDYAWTMVDWMEWHTALVAQYNNDANVFWTRAWNASENHDSTWCSNVSDALSDPTFRSYFSTYGVNFEEGKARLTLAPGDQALVNQILLDDETTYLNLVKLNLLLDSIPTPLMTPDIHDALTTVNQVSQQYNSRQTWLRENSDGTYENMIIGDWSGSQYDSISGVPLVIAAAVIVGLIIGGGAVYYLATASEDAAIDRITSSDAWNKLCQFDPQTCAELEKQIQRELQKVKNRGKAEGFGSSIATLAKIGAGAFIFYKVYPYLNKTRE